MINKKTMYIILVFVLIGICFFSNVSSNPLSDDTPAIFYKHNIIINESHGFHGIRGGIVLDFDSLYPEGMGYTDEEVIRNIQNIFGDG